MPCSNTGFIHHVKHHGEALGSSLRIGGRSHQDPPAMILVTEVEKCRSLRMEAHLVFQAHRRHVVRFP